MSLPELELIKVDVAAKETAYIKGWETKTGRKLGTADPVRILLSYMAGIISQHETVINDRYKQTFLYFARGSALDYKGFERLTERLPAASAIATIKFSMPAVLDFPVVIPAGTRVTAGGVYVFATDKEAVIPVNAKEASVTATCTVSGEFANGLVPGQINKLVDPVAYITTVANTGISNGGSDTESDTRYKTRLQSALEKLSVAGPEAAYKFHVYSAHPEIVDVAIVENEPGVVTIYPLMKNGGLPTAEIIGLVQSALSPVDIRPLNDQPEILSPEIVSYDISITYYIKKTDSGQQSDIASAVQTAVDDFVAWQSAALGLGIDPSELTRRVKNAGAFRVSVVTPVYTALNANQVGIANTITVTYGGVE